ncbi:hypothetical protein PYW07_008456 [Mythimna separata]|uniref:Integrase catalytic domain-containing protein n=1 Tax=Mythimna separata TaxID=271217 RepID=A0AAD8DP14_MYTSE|nr:hypothetical protein PYW07_008456 [Mythimna separata]
MILIGQDNWHLLVAAETRTGARDQPVASYTKLGWVLHGCQHSVNKIIATFCGHIKIQENPEPIEETMKNFFKLESLGIEPRLPRDDPQQRALDILEQKSRRLPDGSFETGLLWKQEEPKIPNNYLGALKHLENLERRLDKDENLKTQYLQRLDNLFNSGYAEKAPDTRTPNKTWYLPHFPVVNPAKPHKPPRLVHDAAAKTAGLCLNDLLLSGPDLLKSLPGVLMRFRQNKIAVSADIKEMFMRIKIREEDRDALRFLWRGDQRSGPPGEYRMTSVIFGATSSPCTALYIKDRNARDFVDKYPAAASAIINNHYMDDYLQSFSSEEEAKKITSQVDYIHKKGNFVLCGWISNNRNVLNYDLAPSQDTKVLGGDDTEKALGLRWDTKKDCFIFRINKNKTPIALLNNTRPPTKREALSIIMSIFDPLGIISPITIPAKRILQNTWKYKTEWDKSLPEELLPKWKEWMKSLSTIETLLIPRCYDYGDVTTREVHTFVDASEEAYAAAVYWRMERSDGSVQVTLAAAKSRVAPLKPVSIPRLELQAALLGARLARTVVQEHDYEVNDLTYWSDSTTALAWIQAEPRTFKTFVAHRVAEIEELTKKNEWRWLPSKDNVADDATRSTPEHFNSEHRWFCGPDFLRKGRDEWPQNKKVIAPMDTGEERVKCHVINNTTINDHLPNITRFSKWTRLIRTTARVLQFIDLCRPSKHTVEYKCTKKRESKDPTWKRTHKNKIIKKVTQNIKNNKTTNYIPIPATYIQHAEEQWIKGAQAESFSKEIAAIKDNKAAPSDSPLSVLSTYLDNAGVLRLRGRITAVQDVNEEIKNPIILEGKHRYTKLYIAYIHESLHHGGTEITVNEIRQRLWITKLRPSVKNVIKCCLYCKIKKAKPANPSTGNLPYPRLAHHARPFTFTGLDYFGPISVSVGRHKEKRYGALFTCLTCRAIHIEIASSLTADSAIAALRRFIARRGCPKEIWSDNATCFKAADRELGESALSALGCESNARSISWKYIPPASPFMGGAWERMVRAVKEALYVTLKEVHPSDETLATLLVEVENTVNSRPLTHVNVSPDEPEALTPNHILIGPNPHVPSPGNFTAADVTARHQWRRAQALADVFWRRWVREYLPLLQNRREPYGSGTPPKVGDVVVICDPNLPRNTWPKGRVTQVLPGKDGEIRVVDVMTRGLVLRRPTKRIVVLPTESPDGDGGRSVHDDGIKT